MRCRCFERRCHPTFGFWPPVRYGRAAKPKRCFDKGADAVALGRSAVINADWPLRAADPEWTPRRPPVTIDWLRAGGLSPAFAEYMRRWEGFVAP